MKFHKIACQKRYVYTGNDVAVRLPRGRSSPPHLISRSGLCNTGQWTQKGVLWPVEEGPKSSTEGEERRRVTGDCDLFYIYPPYSRVGSDSNIDGLGGKVLVRKGEAIFFTRKSDVNFVFPSNFIHIPRM